MSGGFYRLEGHTPVPVEDIHEWASTFEHSDRIVCQTRVSDEVRVSTVFLALDHSFGFGDGRPLLFETMIFGGEHDMYQERYATWDEAVEGHEAAIRLIFEVSL